MGAFDAKTPEIGELVRRHADKAYSFAYRLSGNDQDARDLVQEAFTHVLRHIDKFDPSRPFQPWLNRILKNIFIDSMRKYDRKHTVSMDGPSPVEDVSWENIIPGNDPSPAEELDQKEANTLIQKALESLPMLYRSVVVLCDVERYSYEQIAEILDCPIGTVRSRIFQGRVLLRKAFEKMQLGVAT